MSEGPRGIYYSFFHGILAVVTSVWYFLIVKIFFLINMFKERKIVPPVKDEILLNSAIELARKIRVGETTSEAIVQACIKRINEINDVTNVVVENNFENALAEARRVDQTLANGSALSADKAPLLGVPFTTKDGIPISGMLCTAGIPARKNVRVFQDADCVALYKSAGAIPLATTNVSEVTMWWESYNTIYGRSNNPYDSRRGVGGSSGGEAALQGAAGSVLSIGADIGGSIRIPAIFNGIFGHKPTGNIVSTVGTIPAASGFRTSMMSPGPMCRYAEDLLPMLRILAGANVERLHLNAPVDFQRIRIFYMEGLHSIMTKQPDADMTNAMHRAMKYFETRYNTMCYRLDLSLVHWAVPMWTEAMYDGKAPTFAQEMANRTGEVNAYWEMLKWLVGQSEHTFPAITLALTESVLHRLGSEEQRRLFEHLREKLARQLDELLGDNGVFFFPSHPTPAPFHYQPIFMPMNFAYTGLFNALTLPVTQCPMGLNDSGIPVGIQIVGATCRDHLSIAVAQELEKAFGGWVPPGSR